MAYVRGGDAVVVWKVDSLGRNTPRTGFLSTVEREIADKPRPSVL
jgi:hypothetical protein